MSRAEMLSSGIKSHVEDAERSLTNLVVNTSETIQTGARAAQQALVDGGIHTTSSVELFRLGSAFHEMLAKCSGNPFFSDALQRINRLRRLIEYRAMVDTAHFIDQAREHLKIMDLIEAGDMEAASAFLARHLETARGVKLEVLTSGKRRDSATAQVHF